MEHGDYQRFLYSLEREDELGWRTLMTSTLFPRAQLRSLARRMEQVSGRLATLEPPDDAGEGHLALVVSLHEFAADVRRIARDRRLGRKELFRRLLELPSLSAVAGAGDQLRAHGYVVPAGATRPTP
jgi:hypothetical protein